MVTQNKKALKINKKMNPVDWLIYLKIKNAYNVKTLRFEQKQVYNKNKNKFSFEFWKKNFGKCPKRSVQG